METEIAGEDLEACNKSYILLKKFNFDGPDGLKYQRHDFFQELKK